VVAEAANAAGGGMMRRWVLAAAVVVLMLLAGGGAADTWTTNATIVSGLGDVGDRSAPTVFQKDGTWYLISGNSTGKFEGFNWTGSAWQSDSAIINGLSITGIYSAPAVFYMDTTWYLITGNANGDMTGFNWTGSAWQGNTSIISGITSISNYPSPTVFKMGDLWHVLFGGSGGSFYGYEWTGSTWIANNSIDTGFGYIGKYPTPECFEFDDKWYMITGVTGGTFYGYNWSSSGWQTDNDIVSGLGGVGTYAVPTLFQKSSQWFLISGRGDGTFVGFNKSYTPGIAPCDLSHTKGLFYVNHTWNTTDEEATDSYNVSINGTWHNGTTNLYYNNTLTTYGDWSNITAYAYNNTEGLSDDHVSEDVQLPYPIPATPAGAGSTWDYYWVNHSWTEGSSYGIWCGDTDSYNVSINGTWHNGTTNTYYNNTGLSPHVWSNASIYAFNGTAGINETYIYQNVQMANRAITITNTSDWSGWAGVNVYVGYDATDPDGDTPTFSCNRTDLFTDFDTATGDGNWTTITGTYYVDFGVSDGWGSTDNYTMTLTITSYKPPFDPSNLENDPGLFWVNHTWITASWYLIAGEFDGVFNGYNWTGSVWQSDSGIIGGVGNVVQRSAPTVFQKDGVWYLIAGKNLGDFSGYRYNWTGSVWQSDSGITGGLGDVGYNSAPSGFQKGGVWYLISGDEKGGFSGYNWTGSAWQSDSGIVSGLGGVGYGSAPTTFQKDSTWYLIAGEHDGVFNGFNWTGSTWQSDSEIISGLGSVGFYSTPTIFNIITTDSYNVSINGTWHNGTTNPYYNNTLTTYGDWSNITVYGYNTCGLSNGSVSEDVQLPYPIPAIPANTGSTWDYYWANHTWTEGSSYGIWCGDTDSYNVSINGTWHNGTTNAYYNNTGLPPHVWSNATIYAFNDTAGINETGINQSEYMVNRAITITNTGDWSGWSSFNVYVDYDAIDPDGDTPTFSCSRTDLFSDFNTATGKGNWTAATGTYYIDFGVSDGWGSTDNYTMEIVVVDMWQTPINIAHTTGLYWVKHTWEAGSGGVIADSYNVSINAVWHNETTNLYYTNILSGAGNWSNITVYGYNGTYGLSDIDATENVQLEAFYPPTPINLAHQHGECSVTWTWNAGTGYVTDSYNISIATTFCGEVTTDWHTTTSPTHTFVVTCDQILPTIAVYAWNSTHEVRSAAACVETITALPPITTTNIDFETNYTLGNLCPQHGWVCSHNSPPIEVHGVSFNRYAGIRTTDVDLFSSARHLIDGWGASKELYIYFNFEISGAGGGQDAFAIAPSGWGGSGTTGEALLVVQGTSDTAYPQVTIQVYNGVSQLHSTGITWAGWHSMEAVYDGTTGMFTTLRLDGVDIANKDAQPFEDLSSTMYIWEWANMVGGLGIDNRIGLDDIYIYPIGTFGCYGCIVDCGNHLIVLYDEKDNLVQNADIFIYDVTDDEYIQKWTRADDGIISLYVAHYGGHTVQIGVKTFDGIFVQDVYIKPSGGVTNITIPIHYNLKVYPVDEQQKPLTGVFAGLAEYTAIDPQAFWGYSMTGSLYVPVTNCSGFAMCDLVAEKGGYRSYNKTALNWTSKSAMIKDYRHTAVLAKES